MNSCIGEMTISIIYLIIIFTKINEKRDKKFRRKNTKQIPTESVILFHHVNLTLSSKPVYFDK